MTTITAPTKVAPATPTPPALRRGVDALAAAALLVAAALIHGPVFGGSAGYVAALGGLVAGILGAVLTAVLRVRAIGSVLSLVVAYLLVGGPLALPTTTAFHVLPTPRTIQMLVVGVITSWKDLLTVQPPAGIFVGPAIMPFLGSLVAAFAAVTIVLRTRRPLWALAPIGALGLLGVLWGSQQAPLALPIGVFTAVVGVSWAAHVAGRSRREGGRGIVEFHEGTARPALRRGIGAVALIALALAVAVPLTRVIVADSHRAVVRDYVEPPLNLREYHSPATQFRSLNTTDKDTELLAVEGLPEGGRVRLATLDYYDGTVVQIAADASGSGFRHVGTSFFEGPPPGGAAASTMEVRVLGYTGNWVPTAGSVRSLEYTSERAAQLADGLYYHDHLDTALSTVRLARGDSYRVSGVASRQWSDEELEGRGFSASPGPADQGVPPQAAEAATELVGDAAPGIAQVRAIQRRLHDEGFYSDGSDQLSLPGHRTSRLEDFLSSDQLIGDDDQYAVAMLLMLRSLQIPSRIVMGFHPDSPSPGTLTLTGKDTHLWVEVPFDGAGWVAFDPTPPRDHVPHTEVPKPKPNPKPQVLQPPEPPQDPAELPPDTVDDTDDDEDGLPVWLAVLLAVLAWAGLGALVLSPLWGLLLFKALRRRRRRTTGSDEARCAAAWDDVVDYAADTGLRVPIGATRLTQARAIDARLDDRHAPIPTDTGFHRWDEDCTALVGMARALDAVVFADPGGRGPGAERSWESRDGAVAAIAARTPWHRRYWALLSTRSLRLRRTPLRVRIGRFLNARAQRRGTGPETVPAGETSTLKGTDNE